MSSENTVARDITYANQFENAIVRSGVRFLENASGRRSLIRRAANYADEVASGRDFWELMYERFGLTLDVRAGALENIPTDRPVIIVANHPYGILDGLSLGYIMRQRRSEFKIIANHVFKESRDLDDVILPINFQGGKEALSVNINTRKEALRVLAEGGLIGIFPGATVSTSSKIFGPAYDPSWIRFPTKLLTRSDAVVVPIFFDGSNSRLFQIASHLHYALRLGLLIREFRKKIEMPVSVSIGEPIERSQIKHLLNDPIALKVFLREETYKLGGANVPFGYEFEERYRTSDRGI